MGDTGAMLNAAGTSYAEALAASALERSTLCQYSPDQGITLFQYHDDDSGQSYLRVTPRRRKSMPIRKTSQLEFPPRAKTPSPHLGMDPCVSPTPATAQQAKIKFCWMRQKMNYLQHSLDKH